MTAKVVILLIGDKMAQRQNTFNQFPSNDLADLNDNTIIVDEFANSQNDYTYDRFGRPLKTIHKMQKDFDNKVYVVESYSNDNSWYRIYSDGYIEQSDAQYIETKSINAVNGTFINLLKPMKSYTYGISVDKINSGPWAQTEFAYAEVYPTGFWLASYTSSIPGSVLVRWIVRGY